MSEQVNQQAEVELPAWVAALAASHPFGKDDRRGTVNLIDDAARARAAALVRSGKTVSLSRPLRGGDYNTTPERPGFAHQVAFRSDPDGTGWGSEHIVLNPHGLMNTHVDGLNHVAVNGTYYGGRPVDAPVQGSVDAMAPDGLVTRAVYVDIPALRKTEWASSEITGTEIQAALDGAEVNFERGDALLLDMGRDRFEVASGQVLGGPETDHDAGGGLASDGARWVADHGVSMLAWDMLDSRQAKESHASAHILTWAIGLLLVDNCDYAALRAALGGGTQVAGALVVAPILVGGANGVNVNPVVMR
jgi:kynurenine formamidase